MVAIDELAGLMCLVQAGVVEIHPWGSTVDHLEQPDRLIFDLDPGENVPWTAVIEAAHDVRDRLVALGLQSFVKTSGGKGLHVVVPIEPADWDEVKTFTKTVATNDGQGETRPLRRHNREARTQRSHFYRLSAERPRCHRGCSIFDAGVAAGVGFDTPRLGRTFTRTSFGPLHSREPAASAFISQTRSLARHLQDSSATTAIPSYRATVARIFLPDVTSKQTSQRRCGRSPTRQHAKVGGLQFMSAWVRTAEERMCP